MSLPVPSGEITIAKPVGTTERCIDITCTSNDARSWVEQNLPPYGRLLPPVTSMHNAYRLIVSDAYKVDEVKRYILSQNEDEEISRKLLRMSMNKPNPRVA